MKLLLLFFIPVFLFSCNEKKTIITNEASVSTSSTSIKDTKEGTYLCKINSEDWLYTKASGLVFTEKKTLTKKAVITFKKQLEKGSESIQLEYNVTKNTLVRALVNIKRLNKEGKYISAHYTITDKTMTNINTILFGSVNITDQQGASGTANFKVENKYEKTILKNPNDLLIHVSELKFSGVGYSDLDKTFD